MLNRVARLPFVLLLAVGASAAMLVPSVHALSNEDFLAARTFLYAAILGLTLSGLVIVTLSARPGGWADQDQLMGFVLSFVFLPALMAVPFHGALKTTTFLNAYLEMVSCFTTTGAVIFDPERLPPSLHLWRGMVGWMGGLLMWVAAAAILSPRHLGGFEITSSAEPGQMPVEMRYVVRIDTATRLVRAAQRLGPIYVGLTLVLWLALTVAGDPPLVGFMHAMSTLATSGISPLDGVHVAPSGVAGEAVMVPFFVFALSRLAFSADTIVGTREKLVRDPEFRLGIVIVLTITTLLFLRHWYGAWNVDAELDVAAAARALWGAFYTTLSFLTTTGFESHDWYDARTWSGLGTSGLVLMGLALVGGGVATTAGGVKLLRVYMLVRHGSRELSRMMSPRAIPNAAGESRRLHRQGAFVAWVSFMLFAVSLSVVMLVFTAFEVSFDEALLLAVAAFSNTGPIVTAAADEPFRIAELAPQAKLFFGFAMILGRLETLAIIALLTPELWRR